MKNKTKKMISVLCIWIMLLGVGIGAHADTSVELENYELKALGRIEHDKDGSGIAGDHPSDFVYDADDLYAIEDLVKDGKTNLSNAINTYPTANVQTLDTFANLSAAIDSLTEFPAETYYYDSTTGTDDASELIRYIKENDTYYLCDQNGNKTSDEAQAVDENNLVEYTEMSAENLTAGTAGMVDKSFVLGNGSDNISYRNMGIEYADNRVNKSSASFQAGEIAGVSNAKLHLVGSNPSIDDVQFTVNLSHIPGYKNFVYGTHIICVPTTSYLPECSIDTSGRWMGNSVTASYNSTTGILTVTKTLGYKSLIDNVNVYVVY